MIADSDVLIDTLRGVEPSASRIRRAIASDDLEITVISVFEILGGIRNEADRERAEALLDGAVVYALDLGASAEAADVDRKLRAQGLRLATGDTLIAGIALSHGQSLLTRNKRHFDRIPGLVVEEI